MTKHTFEEKLDIVSHVIKGTPILWLSRERRISKDMILEWVRKYNLHGESGLRKQANIKSTSDFKEEVVRLIIEKGVPLRQVVL
ncbi:helix-turn-helix domain-containing protein, partial [Pedobacter kyonggii]